MFVHGAWVGQVALRLIEPDEDGFNLFVGASPQDEVPRPVGGSLLVGVVGKFFVPQYVGEVYCFRGCWFEGVFFFLGLFGLFTHPRTLGGRRASGFVE